MNKNNAGRLLFDGKDIDDVLSKLRTAWDVGGTDVEACAHADISVSALHRYMDDHPEIREERNKRKEKPVLKARMSVYNKLDEDGKLAMDYLKNKKSDEFNTKQNIDQTNVDLSVDEYLERLKRGEDI